MTWRGVSSGWKGSCRNCLSWFENMRKIWTGWSGSSQRIGIPSVGNYFANIMRKCESGNI